MIWFQVIHASPAGQLWTICILMKYRGCRHDGKMLGQVVASVSAAEQGNRLTSAACCEIISLHMLVCKACCTSAAQSMLHDKR